MKAMFCWICCMFLYLCSINAQSDNNLSDQEKAEGWQLLFDGNSTHGWHNYGNMQNSNSWEAQSGTLHCRGAFDGKNPNGAEDLTTDAEFGDFDIRFDWKNSVSGNSGLMFHVNENANIPPFYSGPEYQIADDEKLPDTRISTHKTGDLYNVLASNAITRKSMGEWNSVEIICQNGKLEIIDNGQSIIKTSYGDYAWNTLVTKSPWASASGFGQYKNGKFVLQNHGKEVWFKNIKIKTFGTLSQTTTANQNAKLNITALPPSGHFNPHAISEPAIEFWEMGWEAKENGRHEEALDNFVKSANEGSGDAAFEIGRYAEMGLRFAKDNALAEKWYRFAFRQGNKRAAMRLSEMSFGKLLLNNDTSYLKWGELSGEGCSAAAFLLYYLYKDGRDLPKDDTKSLFWLTKMVYLQQIGRSAVLRILAKSDSIAICSVLDQYNANEENIVRLLDFNGTFKNIPRTPLTRITGIEVSNFSGSLRNGVVDLTMPFEAECRISFDQAAVPWVVRFNYFDKEHYEAKLLTKSEQIFFLTQETMYKGRAGDEASLSIHDYYDQ